MDREILFRGKRLDNGEWVDGYYCYVGHTGQEKNYIIPTYASAFYGIEVDPTTVGQYTGLTDKNGVKIFEGDIVSAHFKTNRSKQIFGMIFRGGAFQLDNGHVVVGFVDVYSLNVIGNIHDNPELIGGEDDG